jgi:hypothetical protein
MIRKGIFYEMEIPISEENADDMEETIVDIVAMRGQECPEIWKKVSQWLDDPTLRETLRKKIVNRGTFSSDQSSSPIKP